MKRKTARTTGAQPAVSQATTYETAGQMSIVQQEAGAMAAARSDENSYAVNTA